MFAQNLTGILLTFLLVENNFQLKFHLVRETFLNLLFVLLLRIRAVKEMTWAACSRRCKLLLSMLLLANNWIKCTNTFKWVLKCWAVRPSVLTLLHNLRAWISCQIHEPIRAINNWIAICLRIAEHKVRVCKGRRVQRMNNMSAVHTYICMYVCLCICEYFLQFYWDRVLIETTRCSIVKQRVNCNCLLSPWQATSQSIKQSHSRT